MKVFVYWNLHKGLWSVKALDGPDKGRVIARERWVMLMDASGKVSEAGRQRVLREKRKNVHAGIVGDLVAVGYEAAGDLRLGPGLRWTGVTYNPYKYSEFVWKADEAPFGGSSLVYLASNRRVFASAAS